MPHLMFKNVNKEEVQKLSLKLTPKLAEIMNCDTDWINFNHSCNETFVEGNVYTNKCIYVDVKCFDRGDDIKKQVAIYLTEQLKKAYPSATEVIVVFEYYESGKYFENGEMY